MLVNFVHITALHIGVQFLGRLQREAPVTLHMALSYFVFDISSLLCHNVCVQVNLLCVATYGVLPAQHNVPRFLCSPVPIFPGSYVPGTDGPRLFVL